MANFDWNSRKVLPRTAGLLPADSQNGHRQFHLLENFVVCRIGGERRELREASPHASGAVKKFLVASSAFDEPPVKSFQIRSK